MALMITAFHVIAQENGDKYLFDPSEYEVIERALCCSSEGFLDYPVVPQAEVMRAFIKAQNNRRIDSFFRGVKLPEMFWAVFESEEFERIAQWRVFEIRYLLDRLCEWLDDNGIPHYIDHTDEMLKEVL